VSGVLNKVALKMQPAQCSQPTLPSPSMKTDSMKKTDSTNTVSTADTDSSPLSDGIEPGEDFDDLRWWNLLPGGHSDACNYHLHSACED
jgi:hypothetical protein